MSHRLNTYFQTSPELRHLSGEVGRLQALQRIYEKHAPPSLLKSSRVAQLETGTLTLIADNGAVAAKLRQLAPELVRQFQASPFGVDEVRVRVQVVVSPLIRRSGVKPISAAGRARILEGVEELRDSPLKEALLRLAR
jgi:hypothetical protein